MTWKQVIFRGGSFLLLSFFQHHLHRRNPSNVVNFFNFRSLNRRERQSKHMCVCVCVCLCVCERERERGGGG